MFVPVSALVVWMYLPVSVRLLSVAEPAACELGCRRSRQRGERGQSGCDYRFSHSLFSVGLFKSVRISRPQELVGKKNRERIFISRSFFLHKFDFSPNGRFRMNRQSVYS